MKRHDSSSIEIEVNGRLQRVAAGTSLAAALFNAGNLALRRSVSGEPRGVLCGMGVCFECRVRIDGVSHQRACLVTVVHGMVVNTESDE